MKPPLGIYNERIANSSANSDNFYNPLDLDNDIAVGVTLPFGKKNGLFNLSFTTAQQALSNLKLLFSTIKGERPFQPNFGTDLHLLLFEPLDDTLSERARDIITSDISFWLPYIIIDDVEAESNADGNTLTLKTSFRVTENGSNQSVTFNVNADGSVSFSGPMGQAVSSQSSGGSVLGGGY
jgi:phage baseplate assembly protein W